MVRKLKESNGNETYYVIDVTWCNEWTDYFSAIKQGRSADYSMLPSAFTKIGLPRDLFSDLDVYDSDNEDEIINRVSENLYERFFYYPNTFTVYSSNGDFIAEL